MVPKRGKYTKTAKIYQNGENIPKRGKYAKTGKIYQNDNKIYQIAIKYTKLQ
jgi:hypothetical protein